MIVLKLDKQTFVRETLVLETTLVYAFNSLKTIYQVSWYKLSTIFNTNGYTYKWNKLNFVSKDKHWFYVSTHANFYAYRNRFVIVTWRIKCISAQNRLTLFPRNMCIHLNVLSDSKA